MGVAPQAPTDTKEFNKTNPLGVARQLSLHDRDGAYMSFRFQKM